MTLITMILALAFGTAGVAAAGVTANTKWLNTSSLNGVTADLNMSNGGPSFYTNTGQPLPGVYLDGTTFFSLNGTRGNDFVDTWTTAVAGGASGYTHIEARVDPTGTNAGPFLYRVSFLALDGTSKDICADGNNPSGWAIPLSGEWDYVTGARISYGGNKFTWACTTGALGKCAASGISNTLGYEPWETAPYYQPMQASSGAWYWVTIDGKRMHQACTRMIRADYCGDGISHTAVGNKIDVRDVLLNGQSLTMNGQWAAEALWDEEGAIWISCDRWGNIVAGQNICSNNHALITDRCFSMYTLPTPGVLFPIPSCPSGDSACVVTKSMISEQGFQELQAWWGLSRIPVLLGNLTANLAAAPTDQGGDQASP